MKVLKWLAFYAFFLGLTGYTIIHFHPEIPDQVKKVVTPYCSKPISYKVGEIDPKYGISKSEFAFNIDQAADIWDKSFGRDLFSEDPNGILTINLVYDERQNLESQASQIENKLKTQQEQLKPSETKYKSLAAEFKKKITALNSEIADWNSKGGAPEEVYNQLIKKQADLQKEAEELNALAREFNESVNAYNAQVDSLKKTVGNLNEVFAAKPEEGIYDPNTNQINIFLNVSQNELVHTLAHEFGHAIGMQHNTNPKSIMYPLTSTLIVPSKDDMAALKEVCDTGLQDRLKKVLSVYRIH